MCFPEDTSVLNPFEKTLLSIPSQGRAIERGGGPPITLAFTHARLSPQTGTRTTRRKEGRGKKGVILLLRRRRRLLRAHIPTNPLPFHGKWLLSPRREEREKREGRKSSCRALQEASKEARKRRVLGTHRVVVPPEDEGGRLRAVGDDAGQVHGAALLQVDVGSAQYVRLGLCGGGKQFRHRRLWLFWLL